MAKRIIVLGDVGIDLVGVPRPRKVAFPKPDTAWKNWQLPSAIDQVPSVGAAGHVLELIRESLNGKKIEVVGYTSLLGGTPPPLFYNCQQAALFKREHHGHNGDRVWRIEKFDGFSPRSGEILKSEKEILEKVGLRSSYDLKLKKSDFVVINDTGNYFRNEEWNSLKRQFRLHEGLILYAVHRPLPFSRGASSTSELWKSITATHFKRTILIANLWDFRRSGAPIPRGHSWEATVRETTKSLRSFPEFETLKICRWIILRIGVDAALCFFRRSPSSAAISWLVYNPTRKENQTDQEAEGETQGATNAFMAALAKALIAENASAATLNLKNAILSGTKSALATARQLFVTGLKIERAQNGVANSVAYPISEMFPEAALSSRASDDPTRRVLEAKNEQIKQWINELIDLELEGVVREDWSILSQQFPDSTPQQKEELLAAGILLCRVENPRLPSMIVPAGFDRAIEKLLKIPEQIFGRLKTFDPNEAEFLGAISNLLFDYLQLQTQGGKPLSIAVFGAPGSGKSFAVEEIAGELNRRLGGNRLKIRKFNLAQFQRPEELVPIFHGVRDSHLRGELPMVFFDEFDSTELFWLKHFLAPMQDGEFLEDGTYHPIGRAIFVFAGGVSNSFSEFTKASGTHKGKGVKLPDFISRLRGYLDAPAISYTRRTYRGAALLRRALLIRAFLKGRAPNVFADGTLDIDPSLLRALLEIKSFKFGSRSLQAVLEMCILHRAERFDPGRLPPRNQLDIHVNGKRFLTILNRARGS